MPHYARSTIESTFSEDDRGTFVAAILPPMVERERRRAESLHIGRYELARELASGGMASVHLGRIHGAKGFSRVVAIKRILPEYAGKPDFVQMFVNEARLAARVRHPSVVATLDAFEHDGELLLVMEFVNGLSLAKLVMLAQDRGQRVPLRVAAAIVAGSLRGLHAAHEARDETGRSLTIVHRDFSPQNVLVARDGLARVLDFGVAKAVDQARPLTMFGEFKGKLTYAAPEQVRFHDVSRATDIYAAGIVLWELATGRRRYGSLSHSAILKCLLEETVPLASSVAPEVPPALDRIVEQATQREPQARYRSAAEMARDIEEHLSAATAPEVAAWVSQVASREIARIDALVASVETGATEPGADVASGMGTLDADPTELDSMSHAAPIPAGRPRRRGGRWIPLAGASLGATTVLALAGLFATLRSPRLDDAAPSARRGEETLSRAATAPRHAKAAPAEAPAFAAAGSGAHKTTSAGGAGSTASAPPGAATLEPPRPANDCSPPYFFDPSGIKHVKPGCG